MNSRMKNLRLQVRMCSRCRGRPSMVDTASPRSVAWTPTRLQLLPFRLLLIFTRMFQDQVNSNQRRAPRTSSHETAKSSSWLPQCSMIHNAQQKRGPRRMSKASGAWIAARCMGWTCLATKRWYFPKSERPDSNGSRAAAKNQN